MEILLIVLFVIAVVLAIALFSPVMISVDSHNRQMRVRWLLGLELQTPLPGTTGQKHFTIFRRPIPIPERQPSKEAPGVKKEKPSKSPAEVQKSRGKRRHLGRFFVRCLGDSAIRRALARQVSMLLRRIFRSASLSRSQVNISTPDPAFNGMLAGVMAAANVANHSAMRVNFRGENSVFLELRLHPHRILKAFLFFLAGLPHRALFRQWRLSAAAQRH